MSKGRFYEARWAWKLFPTIHTRPPPKYFWHRRLRVYLFLGHEQACKVPYQQINYSELIQSSSFTFADKRYAKKESNGTLQDEPVRHVPGMRKLKPEIFPEGTHLKGRCSSPNFFVDQSEKKWRTIKEAPYSWFSLKHSSYRSESSRDSHVLSSRFGEILKNCL